MRMKYSLLFISLLTLVGCGETSKSLADCQRAVERWGAAQAVQATEQEVIACKAAAKAGNVDAMLTLGRELMKGKVMKEDKAQGFALFLKAAKHGSVDAAYNTALSYVRGEGVEASHKKAAEWFMKAAQKNDPGAAFALGIMYVNGEGLAKDELRAYAWFDAAARTGNRDAKEYRDEIAASFDAERKQQALKASEELRSALESESETAASQTSATNAPL